VPIIDCYTLVGSWPQAEVDLSVEALAAGMQARGVTQSLVTYTSAIFYNATLGNTQALQLAGQHQPLVAVGVINPLDYPHCLDEIQRCLDHGVRVFRLCPREHGYPFSGSVGPLREVLRRLEAAQLLLVDVVGLPAPIIAADTEALLPTATAFTVDGKGLSTLICAAKNGPNVWVETSRLDAGGAIEAAVKHLGVDRVIFGSGSPLRSLGSAVMSVQYAELSEDDRNLIFEGNLKRLLT
jgi:hypothetical protein